MKDGILSVIGTRPEAIKMCPLILELRRRGERIALCVTGQHRELVDDVLEFFGVSAEYDLDIMRPGQSLGAVTAAVLSGMERVLDEAKPRMVLVHGDTATTLAATLACFYRRIPVGHVEAGLRTYERTLPFPEEFNRRAVSLMAELHFAPTVRAARNLMAEGVDPESVFVTGNTVIDALSYTVRPDFDHPILHAVGSRRMIMVTLHRRESRGTTMRRMFAQMRRLADEREDIVLVCPLHPAPEVQQAAQALLGAPNIIVSPPLGTVEFHNLLARSYFAISDSGGVQEEALSLGVPVLVTRRCTERPEGIEAGGLRLVDPEDGESAEDEEVREAGGLRLVDPEDGESAEGEEVRGGGLRLVDPGDGERAEDEKVRGGGLRLVDPEDGESAEGEEVRGGGGLYLAACSLLDDRRAHDAMVCHVNPFGDGHACRRIADILKMHEKNKKLQKSY